jgi:hypothetical protein
MSKKQQVTINPIATALEWIMGSTLSEPRAVGIRFDAGQSEMTIKMISGGKAINEVTITGVRAARHILDDAADALVVIS